MRGLRCSRYRVLMSLKSSAITATTTAALVVTGSPGQAGRPKRVTITPAAEVLIGGSDAQTFPVPTTGVTLELVAGDDVYLKCAAATVDVKVLETGV